MLAYGLGDAGTGLAAGADQGVRLVDEQDDPTLGGGDPAKEHALRTHNPDNASPRGDWTKFNPWRSPGS